MMNPSHVRDVVWPPCHYRWLALPTSVLIFATLIFATQVFLNWGGGYFRPSQQTTLAPQDRFAPQDSHVQSDKTLVQQNKTKSPWVQARSVSFLQEPETGNDLLERGRQIYSQSCADCHGETGEGVAGAYASALIGDESIGQLTTRISETMPEGSPEDCVGEDAAAVAAFIHEQFYGEAAQLRNRPPRIGIARLTAEQLRQSLADLYASQGGGTPWSNPARGLRGKYFNTDHWKQEALKIDRLDPLVNFDFGQASPGAEIEAKKFYVHWYGGLKVDVSGRYEIVVRSTCSFILHFGRDGRELINNHVQSGDKTEFSQTMNLVGGRVYPIKLEFTQRERITESPPAKISLSWTPPDGVEEIIPQRHLIPDGIPATFALQTILPPDDRSYGYERGIAVNAQWDESTTQAALEFGQIAVDELWPAYQRDHKRPKDRRKKLATFLEELVCTAFRTSSLSPEQRQLYVDRQLAATEDDTQAIKRTLLIALKSPYFLYPTAANADASSSQKIANRLALILYDSLPIDDGLKSLAKKSDSGETVSQDDVRGYVWGAVNDFRVQTKTRQLFYQWLNLGHVTEISKSEEKFPGFDRPLVADLKASLDRMINDLIELEDSDLRDLFQQDWTYTTPRLAQFYGEAWQGRQEETIASQEQPAPQDADFVGLIPPTPLEPSVADPAHRFGVLTHPYLTASLAYHDTTSPIHRGVFLIRFILGRTLKPPSAAFSPLSPDLHPELTTRQRVEKQTSPENCQACHVKINGLGFALENYDAVGRLRSEEKSKPIDPTGTYVDRAGTDVHFADAAELADYLAGSPDVQRAFVSRAFQHFVKQPLAAYPAGTLERLTDTFRDSGYNIRGLLVEIAVIAAMELDE